MFYKHTSSLIRVLAAAVLLPLVIGVAAPHALNTCDINKDDRVSTTDALLVLNNAVGLSAPACTAVAECESSETLLRPSRGRLFSGLVCTSGSDAPCLLSSRWPRSPLGGSDRPTPPLRLDHPLTRPWSSGLH